jgi:hypothetical protein
MACRDRRHLRAFFLEACPLVVDRPKQMVFLDWIRHLWEKPVAIIRCAQSPTGDQSAVEVTASKLADIAPREMSG